MTCLVCHTETTCDCLDVLNRMRRATYLRKFQAEPPAFVRKRKRRRERKPRAARLIGNALLSRLL